MSNEEENLPLPEKPNAADMIVGSIIIVVLVCLLVTAIMCAAYFKFKGM